MLYTCRHALARLAGGFALPGTVADYQPWFDNHKRLRELIAELQALSLAITENDPRWDRYVGPPGTSTPRHRTGITASGLCRLTPLNPWAGGQQDPVSPAQA